eukprot:CAMPEP_0184289098 /NCGR_PEP_ID=MMETSP1049-20130417/1555_1 /TAXON_ID=77928 /ORGANISM="Proteomonas sulcata, Strain CCMP704" /LENGTH=788 /DNA_ID=CAMNT_0026595753 /DNA_START=1 /DNA_END=2369 /DNA_ORIENTATION=-
MQVRLNVHSRGDPISMVEFTYLDSPREACAVCALDMMANPNNWEKALMIVVKELKKMSMYGLSNSELQRCLSALLSDSSQLAAQGDRMSNQDQLQFLMENLACGHTFMDPIQMQEATVLIANCLNLEDVNRVAADMCKHLSEFGVEGSPMPSAVVAGSPTGTGITKERLEEVLTEAAAQPVESMEDIQVPKSLISDEKMAKMLEEHKPTFEASKSTNGEEGLGIAQRELQNGIKINYKVSPAESQRGYLRVTVPSGRIAESNFKMGAMAVGARTMQEGGAMQGWSREQVELFCVDHLLMAEITCNEEFFFIDFVFPTSKVVDAPDEVTGMEGVFQVLHSLIHGFVWEEDALERAKQAFAQASEQVGKNLESAAAEHLLATMSGNDARFLSVQPEHLEKLTLEDVKQAVSTFLTTDNVEVSVAGDFSPQELETLALKYLGTIPESQLSLRHQPAKIPSTTDMSNRNLFLKIADSDPRAVAYVAGPAPNRWGDMPDGSGGLQPDENEAGKDADDKEGSKRARFMQSLKGLRDKLRDGVSQNQEMMDVSDYRNHPLFPCVTLQLLQEVLNRRLFSTVRERKRLTYDANFHLTSFERLKGSWYLVTVTAKPELAQKALDACKETLLAARSWDPITRDNLRSAAYELISRHQGALQTTRYYVELMSGLQFDEIANKDQTFLRDFVQIVQAVQVEDVQNMLSYLGADEDEMWTCIGMSGAEPAGEGGEMSDGDMTATLCLVPPCQEDRVARKKHHGTAQLPTRTDAEVDGTCCVKWAEKRTLVGLLCLNDFGVL